MLTRCEVTVALRKWAVPVLRQLLGHADDADLTSHPDAPFSRLGFARLLAFGGDHDLLRHPACIAVRGAVLSALRVARAEAHAAFDTTAAQRRADDDDIDTILGVLPALPTTADVGGWDPDRAVARAVRELSAHIACDWHVASGAYLVSPDNKRLKTLRPTCRADFESRWGAICYAPPDDLLAVGARLKFAI